MASYRQLLLLLHNMTEELARAKGGKRVDSAYSRTGKRLGGCSRGT